MPEVGLGTAERLPKGPDSERGFRGRGRGGGGRGGGRGAGHPNVGAGPVAQVDVMHLDLLLNNISIFIKIRIILSLAYKLAENVVLQDIGKKERTEDVVTGDVKDKSFEDMMLSEPVLNGLRNSGFVQPSPVQMLALPPAKLGFDLIVQSKSGTGKTAVYVVTALEMVKTSVTGLQCLVVAPTREIAVQGATVAMQLGAGMPGLKVAAFIGGISLAEDKVKARNCHLGVGTPGRLKQLLTEGFLPADSVRLVVMDEADKLLEPAFLNDTTDILNLMPKSRQVLALSATYPDQLASIAERFMRSPQHIRPGKASQVLTGVSQFLLPVDRSPAAARQTALKQAALLNVLSSVPYSQALVFSNYSTIAQSTSDFLNSRGFPAVFMSSGQDQARRNAVIQTFKQFSCRFLVV